MAKPLTQIAIDALKPGAARREIPDGKVSGLRLILQPSGAASWALRYRFTGKTRKLTIGTYPEIGLADARKLALEALAEIARGNDPGELKQAAKAAAKAAAAVEEREAADLVERVIDEFVERYAKPNTRDWRETHRLLKKDVSSRWQGRRLSEINRADVHRLLDAIIDRGAPIGANRTFAALRKMCKWAVSRGILHANPCDGVDAPSVEKSRDRVLDADELGIVWRAAGGLGWPYGDIVRLLILTGARRDEVAHATWDEIDLKTKTWTIPAERSKNRRAHVVPLSPAAVEIIEALPRFEGGKFLFAPGAAPPSGFSKAKAKLDAAIVEMNGGEPIPHFVIHDLRRSAASGMASIGIDLHVIERVLNHVSGSFGGIVGVYQKHSFSDEMRRALDGWAAHVTRIATGETADNVVQLRR